MGIIKKYIPNLFARLAIFLVLVALILFIGTTVFIKVYTKDIIENLIDYQTKGKAKVSIGRASIKVYPQTRLDLLDTDIQFLDSTGKNPTYKVKFNYLGLQLQSLRAFLFDKKLLVDFIVAEEPRIEIDQKYKENKLKEGNEAVHFEIGNVFLAIQRIAASMQIKRFGILNGNIILHNLAPNKTTISIGGINFTARELAMLPMKTSVVEQADAGRIRINTGKQDITLPQGNYRIRYQALHLDTEEKLISIDSFKITGKALDTTQSLIEAGFSKFKLYNFDFDALYVRNLIKIDSVICIDPVINMNLNTRRKESAGPKMDLTIEKRIASLIGRLELGYLGLLNSNITITTRDQKGKVPFNTSGNNFEAFDIRIDSSSPKPIQVGKLLFAIKNYTASSKDGMYNMLFDSVVYNDQSLSLKNFRILPSDSNKNTAKQYFTIPDFQLVNLSISELVANKRLKADELLLSDAVLVNNYLPRSRNAEKPQPLRNLIRSISDKIDLEKVTIQNGHVTNRSALDPSQFAIVGGLHSEISLNDMFDASTYELMGYSIGKVSFDSLVSRTGTLTMALYKGEARGKERKVTAARLVMRDSKSQAKISANDIRIRNYHFNDDFSDITIDSISYSSALIVGDKNREKKPMATATNPAKKTITFKNIHAKNTVLDFVSGDTIKAEAKIRRMEISELIFDSSRSVTLRSFFLDGEGISYSAPGLRARTGAFFIKDEERSSIADIDFEMIRFKDTIKSSARALDFVPMLNASLKNKYPVIREMNLENPIIFASLNNPKKISNEPGKTNKGTLDMGSLKINNGRIDLRHMNDGKSMAIRVNKVNLSVDGIKSNINNEDIHIGKTSLTTGILDLSVNDSIRLMIDKEGLSMGLDHFSRRSGNNKLVSLKLNGIDAKQVSFSGISKKGKPFEFREFNVGGGELAIDSLELAHILRKIKADPSLYVNNINFSKIDEKSELHAYGVGYLNGGKVVTIDSFRFKPALDREAFNSTLKFQKDHIQVSTKKIRINNFDIEKIATDSSYEVEYVEVDQPELLIYKDKRLPFESGIIKPLPVDMIDKIGAKIRIDSLRLYNGKVTYEEFNEKTNSIGTVFFTKVNVRLRNVINHGHSITDSLKLGATARFLDTAYVGLRFHQSYTDTLSAFLLQVRIGAFSLPALNPVLRPLANAKIDAGYLDTLELKAIGREYLAHGKMKMLYRDLKLEMLNKADQEKKTLGTKIISWVANILVRRDNFKQTGTVFTERNRERSVFNYWIKIVLSGALTNSGIKKNSKQEKKYKKSLRKANVPEIPEVEL